MSDERQRIEYLISMAERITAAVEADIEAVKSGNTKDMRTGDPEIQRLAALFSREAASFDAERAKTAPAELRKKFLAVTKKMREALALHARVLTRVKNASEGIIKAVAEEVERLRAPLRPYAPTTKRAMPGAMIYNSVV